MNRTKTALLSTLVNIVITLVKGLLAFLSNSSALFAETVHSLSDLVGSLVVLTGMHISRHKSREFPLGLYKVENFVALISSMVIFFAGYEIVKKALDFRSEEMMTQLPLSIGLLFVLMTGIFIFMRFEEKMALRFNSPALKADALHWRTDLYSALIVIIGLFGAWRGYLYADKVAAVIIVLFIAKSGWRILLDSIKSLLDASVDHKTIDQIRKVVTRHPEVKEIKAIIARNAGSYIFAHIDLRLDLKSFKEAHELTEKLESEIKKDISWVERVFIHYEPVVKEYLLYAVPLESENGTISDHYGEAPYIGLVRMRKKDGEIIRKEIMKNPFLEVEKGKGIKVSELLVEKGVNVLFIKEMFHGDGPKYVFSDSDVEVRLTGKKELIDIIEDIKSDEETLKDV